MEANGGRRVEDDVTLLHENRLIGRTEAKVRIENVTLQRRDFLFEVRMHLPYGVEQLRKASITITLLDRSTYRTGEELLQSLTHGMTTFGANEQVDVLDIYGIYA